MENRLTVLQDDLENFYAAWNVAPSLAIVGGTNGHSKIERVVQLASELGINVWNFDSLESKEMQRMINNEMSCRRYLVVRFINEEEEINPIDFIEEVIRDAIGY